MDRNRTVLVISDRLEQFDLTASMLRDSGYYVRFESALSDNLKLSGNEAPFLIISELAVPDVDGLKLCRRVRRDQRAERIPVLLVGDLSKQSSIVEDSFRCGASDYLQKPIDESHLADLCHAMLTDRRPGRVNVPSPTTRVDNDRVCLN